MTLINRPNALPSVALVVYRYLSYAGEGATESDLARALAPASISAPSTVDPGSDDDGAGNRAVDETVSVLKALGTLVSDQSGRLSLESTLPKASQGDEDVAVLRQHLRSRVLSDDQNGGAEMDLWASDRDMRDFTRAMAWFLVQNVWAPPGRFGAEDRGRDPFHEQVRQLPGVGTVGKDTDGKKVPFFNTNIRWNAFQRWAVFLGLATTDATSGRDQLLVPDPTIAVREFIQGMPRPGTVAIRKFVELLADDIPVLDGGRMQGVVTREMAPGTSPVSAERLSPALSHALMRLSDEKLLRLETRSDSPEVMSLASPTGQGKVVARVVLP